MLLFRFYVISRFPVHQKVNNQHGTLTLSGQHTRTAITGMMVDRAITRTLDIVWLIDRLK